MIFKKKLFLFCKFSFIIVSLFVNKSIEFIQNKNIELNKFHKDGHELEYINNFNLLKHEYSYDLFLYSFLKEISIISYDYTNTLNLDNNKIHIMVSLNDKYIYPLIVSMNSALLNSDKNRTNYVLGFLDLFSNGIDYLGINSEKYINAGTILLNLEKIRQDKKHKELLYMALNHKKLKHQDQTVINYIFYPKIGLLPFKYGIFNFPTIFDIKYIYLNNLRQNLNVTELLDAISDPSLMHFVLCYPKVWYEKSKYNGFSTRNGTIYESKCDKFHKIWIKYANSTMFYKEIMNKYNNKM